MGNKTTPYILSLNLGVLLCLLIVHFFKPDLMPAAIRDPAAAPAPAAVSSEKTSKKTKKANWAGQERCRLLVYIPKLFNASIERSRRRRSRRGRGEESCIVSIFKKYNKTIVNVHVAYFFYFVWGRWTRYIQWGCAEHTGLMRCPPAGPKIGKESTNQWGKSVSVVMCCAFLGECQDRRY